MAETKPAEQAPPAKTEQVATKAVDSGQQTPPNAASADAARPDASDPEHVTQAEQSGDTKAIAAEQPKAGVYVLKEGHTHDAVIKGERVALKGGDELELTEAQAASFGDKFELKGKDKK